MSSRYPHRAFLAAATVAVVPIAIVLTLTLAARADAGTYVINNCPSAGNGNAGPWTVFGESQGAKGTCSGGLGDWIGPEGANMPPTGEGDLAGVQVAVPAGSGITIREAKLWWYVPHQVRSTGRTPPISPHSPRGGQVRPRRYGRVVMERPSVSRGDLRSGFR
jgi:hypothetical protein